MPQPTAPAAPPRPIPPLAPGARPDAAVRVPGSKSLTNRALILAALADGETVLEGALFSEDTEACAAALRRVGVEVRADEAAARLRVAGRPAGPTVPAAALDVRLSGTTARFLCPYLALGTGVYTVDGTERMRQRPMGETCAALRAQGVRVDGGPFLPVTIHGAGGLSGGEVALDGDDSSQPASGMLMAAPFARRDLAVRVAGRVRTALPYVNMTCGLMARFGVAVQASAGVYRVPAGARYRAGVYPIEPDASAAAYFWALAALTGGRICTPGVGPGSLQGDAAFLDVLGAMGCTVGGGGGRAEEAAGGGTVPGAGEGGAVVTGPAGGRLRAVDADMNAMSDQALTLAVLALFADGPTRVRRVGHIRLQETDRIAAAAAEVRRLGARCEEEADGFTVWPLPEDADAPVTVATYGDHRMAMSFALAGVRRPGVAVADPGCVAKTFPGYFDALGAALATAERRRGAGAPDGR